MLLSTSCYFCQSCNHTYEFCKCLPKKKKKKKKTDTTTVMGALHDGLCRLCIVCGEHKDPKLGRSLVGSSRFICRTCEESACGATLLCAECDEEKIRADYDQCKWSNIRDKGYKAECLDCAAKLACSACKEKHAPDQLKSFSKGKIHLCGKCEENGYGSRALETHHCGHCTFVGGSGKFDIKSIYNATSRGAAKKCLQCKATNK